MFAPVTQHKFPAIYDGEAVNFKAVMAVLDLRREDLAAINGIKIDSVRYDSRMPEAQRDFLLKCAVAIDHVAEYFEDQHTKIKAWFSTPNPLLGGVSARQMIRLGRIDKLLAFIIDAKQGNLP
jgi:hypothetical protein